MQELSRFVEEDILEDLLTYYTLLWKKDYQVLSNCYKYKRKSLQENYEKVHDREDYDLNCMALDVEFKGVFLAFVSENRKKVQSLLQDCFKKSKVNLQLDMLDKQLDLIDETYLKICYRDIDPPIYSLVAY